MMKTAYLALSGNTEQFAMISLTPVKNDDGTIYVKRKSVDVIEYYNALIEQHKSEIIPDYYALCVSVLVLHAGEEVHRDLVKRVITTSTRNIELITQNSNAYLNKTIKQLSKRDKVENDIEKNRKLQKMKSKDMLSQAFEMFRESGGFPEIDPKEFSYTVNAEVIAAAKTSECSQYLEKYRHIKYIFPENYEDICLKLKDKFPEDASDVIKKLQATKSRGHFSAIALSSEQGQLMVNIANVDKKYVKMEAWKFIRLIECKNQWLKLHEFTKRRYEELKDPFEFCYCKEGQIGGKYIPEKSCISVQCVNEKNKGQFDENATFIMDCTYLLCVYTTLKQLQEDREKFERYMNEAKTNLPTSDLFQEIVLPF